MTIFGAFVLAPDLAVSWADSECFAEVDSRSAGMRTKLTVNAAGFVLLMTGWSSVASRAGCVVQEAPDFATALARLPMALRRASEQAAISSREPSTYGTLHAALIGFDREAGAMTAYRMTAAECFVPLLDHEQMAPCPAMPGGSFQPIGPNEVRMLAGRQMECLRQVIPHARGGPLHVAVIRPSAVTVERLADLSDTAPPAIPDLEKEPAHVH